MIRDAIEADYQELLHMARDAHLSSFLGSAEPDETKILRTWKVALISPLFYARVVERAGRPRSAIIGMIHQNPMGVKVAFDLMTVGSGGVDGLMKDFMRWSKEMEADFVHITNLSGSPRYERLLERVGLEKIGNIFGRRL